MYTIKAYITGTGGITQKLVYNPLLANAGYVITAGTVDLELGKAGSASITIPKYCGIRDANGGGDLHPVYNDLQKMKTIIEIMDGDNELFYGRILSDERGLDGRKKLFLEGSLTFLIDRVMPPMPRQDGYKYQGNGETYFGHCITTYNDQTTGVEPLKMFHLANAGRTEIFTYVSPVYGQTAIEFEEHDYTNVQDALYSNLVDVCGGYIKARYIGQDANLLPMHTIDLVAEGDIDDSEPGAFHHCGQEIRLGENLLDLTMDVSGEELATVIVPLGKMLTEEQTDEEGHKKTVDLERVNIAGYSDTTPRVPYNPDAPGELYVRDETAQAAYGNIWQTVVFDDVEDPAELYTKGKEYLNERKHLLESLTISAVDLSLAGVDVDKIHLGDYVRVLAGDIQSEVQCVKVRIDLLNPAANTYTFERTKKTLSGHQVETEAKAGAAVKAAESAGAAAGQTSQDIGALGIKPVCVLSSMTPAGIADNYALAGDGLAVSDSSSRICVYEVISGQIVSIKASKDNAGVYQWQNARTTPTSGSPSTLVGDPVTAAFDGLAAAPEGASYLAVSQAKGNSTNYIGKPSKGTLA